MATNDLCAELQKDIKMDVNMVRGSWSRGCMWVWVREGRPGLVSGSRHAWVWVLEGRSVCFTSDPSDPNKHEL